MNEAHLHLMLVHVPVVLVPLALLTLGVGMWFKRQGIISAAFIYFVLAAVVIVPAFRFGEGAEEAVEDITGVSEELIEEHEESAELALYLTLGLGAASFLGLVTTRWQRRFLPAISITTLLIGLVSSASLIDVAQRGGKIRHPEAFESAAPGAGDSIDHDEERTEEHDD